MRVLVVGSGGREHALCWRLSQSSLLEGLYCAPGNPGTARCATNLPVAAGDVPALLSAALEHRVDLTVVGPEAPLCAGIQDRFAERGLRLFGPSAAAAQLEGSKTFAKRFMERHGIPTPRFGVFTEEDAAAAYIDAEPDARVVKADGLAAGKGVSVCATAEEAKLAVSRILRAERRVQQPRVLVESRVHGEEASFMAICDGERALPLAVSQDHKAVLDGDRGPNTGGMGAYSPAPVLTAALQREAMSRVILPALRGMAEEGILYRGILYAGLMVLPGGELQVLEFNCRLGDPEAQVVLSRVSSDLLPYLCGAAQGELPSEPLSWDQRTALSVVLTSAGYPGLFTSGEIIEGVVAIEAEAEPAIQIFHAGTALRDGRLVTAGGRVLAVTALGQGVKSAQERAYRAVDRIHWPGMHCRRDIGHRAAGQSGSR